MSPPLPPTATVTFHPIYWSCLVNISNYFQVVNVEETVVTKEDTTEEIIRIKSTAKREEVTQEEPPVKKEKIEEDEHITVKEELEDEDCNLESKIEIVDDMLAIFKTESADLTEFLEDPTDDPATEDKKM